MNSSYAFLECFDQSTVGFRRWSVLGTGVFDGPLCSRGLLYRWITLPGAWTCFCYWGAGRGNCSKSTVPLVLIYSARASFSAPYKRHFVRFDCINQFSSAPTVKVLVNKIQYSVPKNSCCFTKNSNCFTRWLCLTIDLS